VNQLENLSSKADQLNAYFMSTGNPDYFAEDLGRFQHIQPHDIQAAVRRWLPRERRVELAVVPAPRN
jgi:predicted Zn-dependent peptidase